jgi:hypothetical protein
VQALLYKALLRSIEGLSRTSPAGSIGQAHKPDEYVEISELMNCAGLIEPLIAHCNGHRDLTAPERSPQSAPRIFFTRTGRHFT